MKSLSINGYKLHKVQMFLIPYNVGTVSYLSYPKDRIMYECSENEIVLKIPSMLTVELFRKGILSADKNTEIIIGIGEKKIGTFLISDFRYPNSHSDLITITF